MFDDCQYIISAVSNKQYPNVEKFPEFVFLGRSNVGKSSFINALANRKMLARTSSKPGKTQTVNFFRIDNSFYFVDVPGYGYASTGFEKRGSFINYIQEYLSTSKNITIAFLLIDFKVGPTKLDLEMLDYLSELHIPIMVICTKADKIGSTKQYAQKRKILKMLKLEDSNCILTSVSTKQGINDTIDVIREHLN